MKKNGNTLKNLQKFKAVALPPSTQNKLKAGCCNGSDSGKGHPPPPPPPTTMAMVQRIIIKE